MTVNAEGDARQVSRSGHSAEVNPNLHVPAMTIWGQAVEASYHPAEMPYDQGNPYLEALPPIMQASEAAKRLLNAPSWTADLRTQPDHLRLHLMYDIPRFYMPLPQTIELESVLSSTIRAGYQDRNPMAVGHWRTIDRRVSALASTVLPDAKYATLAAQAFQTAPTHLVWHPRRSQARGFSMVGITGAGKSSAMEMTLGLYPQIIRHTRYRDTPFATRQIVWLKLQCPYNGAVGSLCLNFFQAVDDLLETTTYTRAYTRNYRAKVSEMLPAVARVAANHGLGILVIDEIQRLSRQRSGGAKSMLDFFGELVDTIGVPVVLIGTYRAQSILQEEFLEARRGTGFGPGYWGPMEEGDAWNMLMRALFRYQYLKNPIPDPITSGLGAVIHDVSQGIPDFAVKAFVMAQIRAVTTGLESLSAEVIYSATRDGFRLAQPWLDRVRTIREAVAYGSMSSEELTQRLAKLPDVDPIDLTGLIQASYQTHHQRVQTTAARSTGTEQQDLSPQQLATSLDATILAVPTMESSSAETAGNGASEHVGPEAMHKTPKTTGILGKGHASRKADSSLGTPTSTTMNPNIDAASAAAASVARKRSGRRSSGFPVHKYHDHEGLAGIVARGVAHGVPPYQALRSAGLIFNPLTDALPSRCAANMQPPEWRAR